MSPCENRGGVIVCTRSNLRFRSCRYCGRFTTILCDFPIASGKTCDAPVCVDCSTPVGEDKDYCKVHNADPR
jgi:hypothetical protein